MKRLLQNAKPFGTLRTTPSRNAGGNIIISNYTAGRAAMAEAASSRAAVADSLGVYQKGMQENVVAPFVRLMTYEVPGVGKFPFVVLGGCAMVALLQSWYGTQDNPYQPVFDESFITKVDPEALVEFYEAEELLHIIAVHPIFFDLFMSKVDFDTAEMTEETALLPTAEAAGTAGVEAEVHLNVKQLGMEVSFEIIKQEDEIDGEEVMTHFCRHERFIDYVPILNEIECLGKPKFMLWDQTWKFEFDRLEDGSYKVTHKCTKYAGPFPVRFIVWLHQKYVIWACEKYINTTDFGQEEADMDEQQRIIANIPMHIAREATGVGTMQQRKDILAMGECFDHMQEIRLGKHETPVFAHEQVDPNRPEFWRMDAISRQMPGFRNLIKAPVKQSEDSEESEESED
jgi:hypothetical protein